MITDTTKTSNIPRSLRHVSMLLLFTLLVVAAAKKGAVKGPECVSGEHKLIITNLTSSTKADLQPNGTTAHKFQLTAAYRAPAPDTLDVVAVSKYLLPVNIFGANGKKLLSPKARAKARKQKDDFAPILDYNSNEEEEEGDAFLAAEVQIRSIDLLENAYTIEKITVESKILTAKKRVVKTLPATTMENYQTIVPGLKLRVASVEITDNHELKVKVNYKREEKGVEAAFVDKVYALDTNGAIIGGGRWSKGSPFKRKGTVQCVSHLRSKQQRKSFRFNIVTSNQVSKIKFDIKDIFKQ